MSANMTRRNGAVIKTIIVVAVMLCGVYFIYLYNNVSGKLKETERVAERYRREQESLRTQLQDLSAAKDEQQQRSENEKKEFVNRLNTLNQHHKMLKSQHDDLEADYARLQSEKDKQKDDVRLQEEQRNQEYMQLKQEKDLEISSLKDQIANLGREKAELEQQVFHLSAQLKESQKIQEQMRTEQSDITQQAQTLKNQLVLERSSRTTLENQIQQLKKENLHYQGSVNFLQQELFNMQEQVKRQQIQLLQTQQSQKSQNALGQQSQKIGQSQNAAAGQQSQGGLQQGLNHNLNHQGNVLNGNENFGNVMDSLQGEGHPVVGGNAVNQGHGSLGNGLGINQGAAIKVNRFNQGLKVKTGDVNLINQGKQDSNVIDQQQQQHQVQPPNLNHQMELQKNEGADGQILPPGGQQQPNANAIDAQQQQHQVAPPVQNLANKEEKNYLQNGEGETKSKSLQGVDLIDAHQQQHQVAPPGGHIKVDQGDINQAKTQQHEDKKPDSNMAAEDMNARADGVAHQVMPPGGEGARDMMAGRRGGVEPQHNLPNPNDVQSILKVGNEEHQQNLPLPADPDKDGGKGGEHASKEILHRQQQPALPNM